MNSAMGFSLGEQLDITQVMDIKDRLQVELEQSDSLLIDGSEVSRVDAPGLQLLLTAKTVCQNQSINWKWQGASNELVTAAKTLGLVGPLGLNDFAD
ncbi:STAS domain-containing protein [Enterovibrio sp. ZSDZ35]|uniref:STAS domain-containing protein n=1 Tax=Enterovibrio qingdaonensis TaxID=2899818 RepID=A0ABT5QNP2_9GAMM|nr:STAS domain-containing protein [Enterovibrio sp. ZSDZ35]MDD1782313.1 STAS domain-containing protein [Enterovibrio sp. ZSDZ35]